MFYPGLPTHPGHKTAQEQMRAFGGMVSFRLLAGEEAAVRTCGRTRLFTLGESLGGVESLIEHPARMTHASVAGSQLEVPGYGKLVCSHRRHLIKVSTRQTASLAATVGGPPCRGGELRVIMRKYVIAAGLVAGTLALNVPAAQAGTGGEHPPAGVVLPTPATGTPHLANSSNPVEQVHELVQCGGTMYAVGFFSSILQGSKTYPRTDIFSFSATAPYKVTSWAPHVVGQHARE